MRTFLATIAVALSFSPALADDKLSEGEKAWGAAVYACFQREAPDDCLIRTDNPSRPGKLSPWCRANTPHFVQIQKTCVEEANAKKKSGIKEWKPQ